MTFSTLPSHYTTKCRMEQHQHLWILTKPTTKELVTQNPITKVGVLDKALFDTGSVR